MNSQPTAAQSSGVELGDIYYTLFRHKWKILVSLALGVVGGSLYYFLNPPPYQSEAKLFIRYVNSEKPISPTASPLDAIQKSPDMRGETIMSSEAEIIQSMDLAFKVAENVGPARILAKVDGGNDLARAAALVREGLQVEAPKLSSVIRMVFTHPDAEIPRPVLRELIAQYLRQHVEIHRAVGLRGEFLSQETDQLRSRLAQTEEELRKVRNRAGIISLEDSKKTYTEQLASLRQQIFQAQAHIAEQQSILKQMANSESGPNTPETEASPTSETVITPAIADEYRSLLSRIEFLQKQEQSLLLQFTPENSRVSSLRSQLAEAQMSRSQLEQSHPLLVRTMPLPTAPTSSASKGLNLARDAAAAMTAAQARLNVLTGQYEQMRAEAAKVDEMEGAILELRRRKELEEANYRYYSASLEQSRINEALSNGRVSNISEIQTPTLPTITRQKTSKNALGIAFGALAAGLAWAFAKELVFDRSIKRPVDIERHIQVPLFLSIPDLSRALKKGGPTAQTKSLPAPGQPTAKEEVANPYPLPGETTALATTARSTSDAFAPFHETLRDRLVRYFESVNLTHKPKLVAVTGLAEGAGVTTTATGLARSLSDSNDANVLLVDMSTGGRSAHHFRPGQPACGLEDILAARDQAQVGDNLFVVSEGRNGSPASRNLPRRFTEIVPRLKASDFDYIIFDMPAVSQISITPRLAGFMDIVLLVVESGKSDREIVQRATKLLAASDARVGTVLNKTRNYVPKVLYQEFPTTA